MSSKEITISIIVAIILVGGWFALRGGDSSTPNGSGAPSRSTTPLPDVSLKDYDGNEVRLSDFSGKPLVVNVWATWCPFCVDELADFAVVQEEFGEAVTIVAVDRAESRAVAQKFTDELGLTDKLTFLLDANDSVYAKIGGFSMPETLFIRADGEIVFHKRGVMSIDEIRERTRNLIEMTYIQ